MSTDFDPCALPEIDSNYHFDQAQLALRSLTEAARDEEAFNALLAAGTLLKVARELWTAMGADTHTPEAERLNDWNLYGLAMLKLAEGAEMETYRIFCSLLGMSTYPTGVAA